MKLQIPDTENSNPEAGANAVLRSRETYFRKRTVAVALAVLSLLLSVFWEPVFFHEHEQIFQVVGIVLIAMWTWVSDGLSDVERQSIEKVVFILFLAMVCTMVLRPDWLHAEPRLLTSYRGMPRWKGWTVDPNNTGIILALASVIALRLRKEIPRKFSALLLFLAALCALELARSFSRIGMLTALMALLVWFFPKWQTCERRWKLCISLVALAFSLNLPWIVPLLRSSDVLLLRRATSFTNVMDLSWANRLYTMPGTIEAMLDRPFSGWGWNSVLTIHQKIYSPTFLPDSTAVHLNDYANLGASYGIPLLAIVVFLIGWCLIYGTSPYAKMTVVVFSVAMFFQGVVRVPLTFIPLCISLGILIGEHPPWRKENWKRKRVTIPIIPILCVLAFLGAWCVAPLVMTNKKIDARESMITVSPEGETSMTIVFVTDGKLSEFGREARAVASLGINAVIIRSTAMRDFERSHGTNTWFISASPGERHISWDEIKAPRAMLRGVQAVRKVFDAAKIVLPPMPAPDKPYPIQFIVLTLFICVIVLLIRESAVNSHHPLAVSFTAIVISIFALLIYPKNPEWREENRQVAEWAQQMKKTTMPDEIYKDYVLSPVITPSFNIRNRRELWHTFYQTSRAEDPRETLNRVKAMIDVQMLICPDISSKIRPFEEIWRTRTCSFAERLPILAAVLRTLNIPARMRDGKVEAWIDGQWLLTTR